LEAAGYSVELAVWDWTAGTSFVAAMDQAPRPASRVLALASPDYFAGTWSNAELEAAFVRRAQDSRFLADPALPRRLRAHRLRPRPAVAPPRRHSRAVLVGVARVIGGSPPGGHRKVRSWVSHPQSIRGMVATR